MGTIFLEEWIHQRIRRDREFGQYTGKELEEVTRQDVETFQLFRLRKTLDHVYEKSAFYRGLFHKEGIDPKDVKSLDDLAKIPFTEPKSLSETPYRFLCVSLGDVGRVFTLNTAGTTGAPKKIFFTQKGLNEIADYMGALMKTVALCGGVATEGCVVYIMLPDGRPASQAQLLAEGVRKIGGLPIVADTTLGTEEQIKGIEGARPAILFGSVSRIHRITQEARLYRGLDRIGVKIVFLTSEYLSEAMRNHLRGMWNRDVYLHYGTTEMGFGGAIECHAHEGFHFSECDFLFEVVDPATGAVLKDGEEGELVFTTLGREGMPLIRYKTGDISCLIDEPCECGASTLKRIGKVTRRIKAIVKIGKGDEIYPSMFDDVLHRLPNIIDYQPTLIREGDKERITIKVEVMEKGAKVRREIARAVREIAPIEKNIRANLMTEPEIELVDQGMLRRGGRTKRLIIDSR